MPVHRVTQLAGWQVAILFAACLLTMVAGQARAQILRGTVVLPDSTTPAPGLLVELTTGDTTARTLTDQRGLFSFRLARPDSARLRVLRIGYGPTLVPDVFVSTGAPVSVQVVLANQPYHLTSVTVRGASQCGRRADTEGWRLWEQALTLVRSVELAVQDSSLRIQTVQYEGPTTKDGITRIADDSVLRLVPALDTQPLVHYDSLFERGFVRRNAPDTAMTYYAPDARLLGDERFGPGYCFRRVPGADSVPGRIGVAFEPVRRRRLTDIEGTLWFDKTTFELSRIDFEYVQLPQGHNIDGPGGYVEFTKLSTGQWIVSDWMLRMARMIVSLGKCDHDIKGQYVGHLLPRTGCAQIVYTRPGLWALAQLVHAVSFINGTTLYSDDYAASLAKRAAAVARRPR